MHFVNTFSSSSPDTNLGESKEEIETTGEHYGLHSVSLFGICTDTEKSSPKGCAEAPNYLRKLSHQFTGETSTKALMDNSVYTDFGNFNPQDKEYRLPDFLSYNLKTKKDVPFLMIGGDHGASYFSIELFLRKIMQIQEKTKTKEEIGLIWMDAHLDCIDNYPKEIRYSHGTVLRRVVEDFSLSGNNILIIGGNSPATLSEEREFIEEHQIQVLPVEYIQSKHKRGRACLAEFLQKHPHRYLSLDIDVFDAPNVPGTGNPEFGGLSFREFLEILSIIRSNTSTNQLPLNAADLVEFNPALDSRDLTATLALSAIFHLLHNLSFIKTKEKMKL